MENTEDIIPVIPHNSDDEIDQSSSRTPSRRSSGILEQSSTGSGAGSFIWNHFTKDTNYKDNKKVTCNRCNKVYICSGGSTSGITRHLKNVHNIIKNQNEQINKIDVLSMLQKPKVSIFFYNFNFINY
jgi:hypothetical protein